MTDTNFLPSGMKWSVLNVLIVVPLIPLLPVVATWFLPWEDWIPKKFSKWLIGSYFLYVSLALWHFEFSWWGEVCSFLIGIVTLILAFEEEFNN
jgi:hypothetical protein